MKGFFWSVISAVLLVGCAFSESSDVDNSQQQKYNKIIEKTYGGLIGTYDGTLRLSVPESGAQDPVVRMILFLGTETTTNQDGTPGTRKVPLAYLRIQSDWIEIHNLKVQGYNEDDGTFAMQVIRKGAPGEGQAATPEDIDSASLRRQGPRVFGPLRTVSGIVGDLELTYTSNNTTVPRETEDIDNSQQQRYNRIIQRTYGPLIGTYDGVLRVAVKEEGAEDPRVRMIVFLGSEATTNPDGTPGTRKVPMAFLRIQSNWIENHNLKLQGFNTADKTFSMQVVRGSGPGQAPSADDVESASLRLEESRIVGPLRTVSGVIGNLELNFESRDTTIPRDTEDEAANSRKAYLETVVGVYEGQIDSQEGPKPISIEFSLAQNNIGGQTNYYLLGIYKRLDHPSGIIDLNLDVTMYLREVPSRFVMNGQGGGNYRISIEATLSQGVMTGRLSTFKGPRGPIRLTKVSR